MSPRDGPDGNVRGISGTKKYGKKNYLLGEDTAEAAVPRLRVGVDGGVDNVPPQVPACNIAVNQLGQANC